jgi:uncharacterized protein (TIGR03083 family)
VPTQLTTARHLDGLREAMRAFTAYAGRAGLDAPVPTCPDWTVRDLVAHQGMVHRWAAALVRGERPSNETVAAFESEGQDVEEPLAWLGLGADALVQALTEAPVDLVAPVFLDDAPPARAFWARRQCHETTMHGVDALAASLGRSPRPDEDALLVVRPDDLVDWWEVSMGPRPALTTRRTAGDQLPEDADWELTGGAVELYLRLWNRTDAPEEWRRLTAVTWS